MAKCTRLWDVTGELTNRAQRLVGILFFFVHPFAIHTMAVCSHCRLPCLRRFSTRIIYCRSFQYPIADFYEPFSVSCLHRSRVNRSFRVCQQVESLFLSLGICVSNLNRTKKKKTRNQAIYSRDLNAQRKPVKQSKLPTERCIDERKWDKPHVHIVQGRFPLFSSIEKPTERGRY